MVPEGLTAFQAAAVKHDRGALLIAAAAGSGKTRVLVERLMSRVTAPDGPDIDDYLVITFTRAAAAELRERISGELVSRLAEDPSSRRLRRQLALVSRAHISTIDAFCSEIVRANAHLLGIRPDFRVADDSETEVIHARVMERLLEEKYTGLTPEFEALAETMNQGKNDKLLETAIRRTYDVLQAHAYPRRWIEERLAEKTDGLTADDTDWGKELLAKAKRRNAAMLRRLSEARIVVSCDDKAEKSYGPGFDAAIGDMEAFGEAIEKGWDAAVRFGGVRFDLGGGRVTKKTPEIEAAKRTWDSCKAGQDKLKKLFPAESGVLMEEIKQSRRLTDELLRCVLDYGDALDEEKKRRNVLEFGDILHLAVRLLIDDGGRPTPRALDIAGGFAEILVDEYQDVSDVQDMIFRAISKDGKNLVFVGDVKQSIYRFRLADPTIFLTKYNTWKDAPAPGAPRRILLSQNFRSRQGVLDAVNDVFSRIMSVELGEMEYGEKEALIGKDEPDTDPEKPFEMLLLDAQGVSGDDKLEAEAAATALRLRRLLDSGMEIEGRPLEPSDIAVLLRSVKDGKGDSFAAALRREGIPVSVRKDESALDAAVSAVLSYLSVIDNPRQDVELIAVLRSPIFGFSSDELAAIRAAVRDGDFYSALAVRAREDAKCAAFMSKLLELREAAPELGLERLLRLIYDESGILALSDQGGLYALLDAARAFEARGGAGLYGFVSELREMKEAGKPFALPQTGRAAAGVTVCTMHASKGLEWPVVVLADLPKKYTDHDRAATLLIHKDLGVGAQYVDVKRRIKYPTLAMEAIKARAKNESLSEEMRLLYVAMTRAKRKLIMITAPPNGRKKWDKTVGDALELDPDLLEDRGNMTDWLLLVAAELSARDPKWVPEIVEPAASGGVDAPPEPGQADAALAELISERLDFAPPYPEAWKIPSKLTATELKGGVLESEAAEGADTYVRREPANLRRPVFESEGGRLSPTERGTALHKAVQFADLALCVTADGARAEIERLRERHMLTNAEADSVKPEAIAALAGSPLGKRMLAAKELRREFKFSLLIPAGELLDGAGEDELLLQGVVDCLFDEGDGLVIVDFKSDNVTKMTQPAAARRYAPQLGAYAKAMERIFERPVVQKLLYFFRTGEAVEIK
ncbi:MAG: UvrD-helicase domain-containing protein [Oscillospiraceae bacterium]|nr:UvrD-helicase domain-containing protein [Oscillospiraceae bacterium]